MRCAPATLLLHAAVHFCTCTFIFSNGRVPLDLYQYHWLTWYTSTAHNFSCAQHTMCTIIQYIMCKANFSAWPPAIAVTSIQFRGERTVCTVCTNIVSLIWISVNSMCTLYSCTLCVALRVHITCGWACISHAVLCTLHAYCPCIVNEWAWIALNQCKNFVSGGPIFLSAELVPFILFYFDLFLEVCRVLNLYCILHCIVYCKLYIV